MLVEQIENVAPALENAYPRAVAFEGNTKAQKMLDDVFEPTDAGWRAIGVIPQSGLKIRKKYERHDAEKIFDIEVTGSMDPKGCACGEILIVAFILFANLQTALRNYANGTPANISGFKNILQQVLRLRIAFECYRPWISILQGRSAAFNLFNQHGDSLQNICWLKHGNDTGNSMSFVEWLIGFYTDNYGDVTGQNKAVNLHIIKCH